MSNPRLLPETPLLPGEPDPDLEGCIELWAAVVHQACLDALTDQRQGIAPPDSPSHCFLMGEGLAELCRVFGMDRAYLLAQIARHYGITEQGIADGAAHSAKRRFLGRQQGQGAGRKGKAGA